MNPYRIAEYTFAGLCVALILLVLGMVAWLITVTESWKGVGITALVVAGFLLFGLLDAEWHAVEEWWVRKRTEWDNRRSTSAGDEHGR